MYIESYDHREKKTNLHSNSNDFNKTKYNPEVKIKEHMSKLYVFFPPEIISYEYQRDC